MFRRCRLPRLSLGCSRPTSLTLADLLKAPKIVLDCHCQLEQLPQQVLGALKLNAKLTWPELNARQFVEVTVKRFVAALNQHGFGPQRAFGQFEALRQPPPARPLLPELAARFEGSELPEQGSAVNQECLAGLIAAKLVQQLNRAAPPDPEDLLEGGPVQDGGGQRRNSRTDGGKSKKPGGLSGQGGEASAVYVTAQLFPLLILDHL